jgi:hypothetical protein
MQEKALLQQQLQAMTTKHGQIGVELVACTADAATAVAQVRTHCIHTLLIELIRTIT